MWTSWETNIKPQQQVIIAVSDKSKIQFKIHEKDKELKERFYPTEQLPKDDRKNADALIAFKDNKQWVADFKITGTNKFQSNLHKSSLQASYAIIKFKDGSNLGRIDEIKNKVRLKVGKGDLKAVYLFSPEGRLIFEFPKNTTAEER